ncbi:MAG: class I SAM-dependent methyltransferase [Myxococcota bacterium]
MASATTPQQEDYRARRPVSLGNVQETLLIPLYARAVETKRTGGLLEDPRAVEIVDQLDYDFSKWNSGSLAGACLRTRIFDEFARRFLEQNPAGTIVEIGCGLNTRFERIDNGRARWFELDLPDVIDLRRQYFEDAPRRTMIAASVLDEAWMDPVLEAGGPTIFLSEAVIIYLEEAQVKQIITQLAKKFPGAWLVTDTCTTKFTTPKASANAMKRLSIKSWFKWACDDPKAVESWHPGIELVSSMTAFDASPELKAKLPFSWRVMLRVVPWLVRLMTKNYRFCHYRLGKA